MATNSNGYMRNYYHRNEAITRKMRENGLKMYYQNKTSFKVRYQMKKMLIILGRLCDI